MNGEEIVCAPTDEKNTARSSARITGATGLNHCRRLMMLKRALSFSVVGYITSDRCPSARGPYLCWASPTVLTALGRLTPAHLKGPLRHFPGVESP